MCVQQMFNIIVNTYLFLIAYVGHVSQNVHGTCSIKSKKAMFYGRSFSMFFVNTLSCRQTLRSLFGLVKKYHISSVA
jgi:hypothetical protein